MRKGIATVSLSGVLTDKLVAIADAGFDGIEVFDNDLVASPLSPRQVARRCADLGLAVDLFQPVRDVEGVPDRRFADVLRRVRTKLRVMADLGATTFLACSNVAADAVDDPDVSAAQLHEIGDLAAQHGCIVAFEALAWGRHISHVADAWDVVRRADHPAVTLAVDTFHMLSRGNDGSALDGVPGDRIGFLQVADAPLLDMNVLEWSRHHRCFPGQGGLDVAGVVATVLRSGYRGPVSLEVFSDVVRESDPRRTAGTAMRSLLFLEDQLAADPSVTDLVTAAPAAPPRVDTAFLEIPSARTRADVPLLLEGLGFTHVGDHRTKPVRLWRNGGARVVVNESEASAAIGVTAAPVSGVAARAEALLWPAVATSRGEHEAPLPGITAPSGLHVFVSDGPGGSGDWQRDFLPVDGHDIGTTTASLTGIDHVGVAVLADVLDEEVGFFRTLFDLSPSAVEEFMEPHGRLRSRALRPRSGDARMVLNVEETARDLSPQLGITQVAFACDDAVSVVRDWQSRGVAMMPVPDNYYVDLEARFGLSGEQLATLREHGLLYDRAGRAELLHAYTDVLSTGFYVEVLERRNGYDAYGSPNTHVRLAAQSRPGADVDSEGARSPSG
jgi:4-hydroxyphenylpyruvate dioxygenase